MCRSRCQTELITIPTCVHHATRGLGADASSEHMQCGSDARLGEIDRWVKLYCDSSSLAAYEVS